MERKGSQAGKFFDYLPLFVLVSVAALGGVATAYGAGGSFLGWMHYFMGFFLCQFAMLKLFDINGFADGFQMYDLIARHCRTYALLYPFIELLLGLLYLARIVPEWTYAATVLVMGIGTIGVVRALFGGMNVHCACMGTILKVPLSTVTLSEDIGMGVMAALMLWMRFAS